MMKNIYLTIALLICAVQLLSQGDSTLVGGSDSLRVTPSVLLDGPSVPPGDSLADALDEFRMPFIDTDRYRTSEEMEDSMLSTSEIAGLPDSLFISRLEALDMNSPFRLDYNRHVRYALNNYLGANSQLTARALGLSELYFPLFEEALDREGLPLELKYLAIVESALRPTARSRAGATGLWQFMYGTGKEMGLRIDSYVDERKDPRASTDAACKYLKKLYGMYGDWNLALAAYNSGPGNVNKAIRRAGGKKDYWEIWAHLPRETRGYVPAFIAVNYAMSFNQEHNIYPIEPTYRYSECDTVQVTGPMTFAQIAEFTGADLDMIRQLNPQYHKDYIPLAKESMVLRLPITAIGEFVSHEHEIREFTPEKVVPTAAVSTYTASSRSDYYSTEGLVKEHYTVRSGDVIGVIADRYGVGLSKLRYWNNISGSRINVGQKLVIYRDPNKKVVSSSELTAQKQSTQVPIDPAARYHTIRPGDTLWDIAKMYDGVTVTEIKTWNSHLDFKRLKPGQKVRVSS